MYRWFFMTISFWITIYSAKIVFIIFSSVDNILITIKGISKIFFSDEKTMKTDYSRRSFLKLSGLAIAGFVFGRFILGILHGRFNYKIKNITLVFKNLPKSFEGFKIVQLSDFHIGSFFGNEDEVKEIVSKVNELNPDLIVFTGDMVNNFASELDPFIDILHGLKAPFGKLAILGNHDYGKYVKWNNEKEQEQNQIELTQKIRESGFHLLLNNSVELRKGNENIWIAGVENWGLPPFPQYGNLDKTLKNIPSDAFKILLSHDPSHWDAEVLPKTNIDLTLSGHTHGMQMGIELGNIKWSPVSYKYPRWSGLYKEKDQYLYVNIGIGYIAFAGRVGMPPEITEITLNS